MRLFFTGCAEEQETLSRKLHNDSVWVTLTAGVATPRLVGGGVITDRVVLLRSHADAEINPVNTLVMSARPLMLTICTGAS